MATARPHLLQALRALRLVLEGSPRLLGLLATKQAVDPLLECLRSACTAGLAVRQPDGSWAAAPLAAAGNEAAASLAATPPPWVLGAGGPAAAAMGISSAELEEAELALAVLLRLTAHAGCIEALSCDKCIAQCFWLAYRAPNAGERPGCMRCCIGAAARLGKELAGLSPLSRAPNGTASLLASHRSAADAGAASAACPGGHRGMRLGRRCARRRPVPSEPAAARLPSAGGAARAF